MAAVGRRVYMWSVLVLFLVAEGFSYPLSNWLKRWDDHIILYGKTVEDFAYTDVCRTEYGQKSMLRKLKSKLCGLDDSFIISFIADMCYNQSGMLVNWVAELFDIDNMQKNVLLKNQVSESGDPDQQQRQRRSCWSGSQLFDRCRSSIFSRRRPYGNGLINIFEERL